MASHNKSVALFEMISALERDRSWLLEQIDKGRWSAYRIELATLERELGQLLTRLTEHLEE